MKRKKLNRFLIEYEMRNITGNIFVIIFGVFFPMMMSVLFSIVLKKQMPEEMYDQAVTSIFITMSIIIPMAVLLIGYAATYSQELEKDIPLRLKLFGYSERTLFLARIIAYLIFTTLAFIVYVIFDFSMLKIQIPKPASAICLIVSLYAVSIILFVLAHGLATFFRKFGPTYAISMVLYFGFMILCGMMGVTVDQLPGSLRAMAKVLPMSYISSDFVDFWQGGSYNFVPMIQAYLFFGAVSFIVLILSIRKNQRIIK